MISCYYHNNYRLSLISIVVLFFLTTFEMVCSLFNFLVLRVEKTRAVTEVTSRRVWLESYCSGLAVQSSKSPNR